MPRNQNTVGLRRAVTLVLLVLAAVTLTAGTALAHHKPGHTGGPSGGVHDNRGTVKIHEGAGEPSPLMRNQPQVCEFHVHGFKFHDNQDLEVSIVGHGGNAGPSTYSDSVTTDTDGGFRSPVTGAIELSDGTYKLTVDTGKGAGKQKVFKIDCAPEIQPEQPAGGGGDQGGPTPGGGDQGGPTPGGGGQSGPGGGPGIVPGGSGAEGPVNPPKPGELPETATEATDSALPLGAAIVLLVALGGFAFAVRKSAATTA